MKTDSIKKFLTANTLPDLAALYSYEMEVQVNVIKGDGERVDNVFKGHRYSAWSDGYDTWKAFRIPHNADSEPEYEDRPLTFSLDKYADAIGMTGWNWVKKQSLWVAYDFDSITTHKAGISEIDLSDVREAAKAIPWVEVRYSTSGSGLHLYVKLDNVNTVNHTEHAAVGRAVLARMSSITGYDFENKVDICGGNMWVWARKMAGTEGLKVIKPAEKVLSLRGDSWKEQLDVCKRKTRSRVIKDRSMAECVSNAPGLTLDDRHKQFIHWLEENAKYNHWWDQDHGVMVAHTLDLKKAHSELEMDGIFDTDSSGTSDHNCFMYPMDQGSWSVRRFTQGVSEKSCWLTDGNGWTQIDYNRLPTFDVACNTHEGTETEKDGYVFHDLSAANKMLISLGCEYTIPKILELRPISVKQKGLEQKVVLLVEYAEDLSRYGWTKKTAKKWQKVLNVRVAKQIVGADNYDHVIRKLTTESGVSAGWVVKADGKWTREADKDVARVLTTFGLKTTEAQVVMGTSVMKPFTVVRRPFEPEYLGGRIWNKDAPQLNFEPSQRDHLNHPTWDSIFEHIGKSLTPFVRRESWCMENNIMTGADYLRCWVASLLQHPSSPLPYLFIYGLTQGTGKSTFWESIDLLFSPGVTRAEHALKNQSGFNGELEGSLLCIVEEEKINEKSLDKIKSWVTSKELSIRRMYQEVYTVPNFTHWIQCANPAEACPIFDGDTRITMINVRETPPTDIPRNKLQTLLKKEAPDVLAMLLRLEIPEHDSRLRIPIITTDDKYMQQESKGSEMDLFLRDNFRYEAGDSFAWDKFVNLFNASRLEAAWDERKVLAALNLEKHPVGIYRGTNTKHIGNLTVKGSDYKSNDYRYISVNKFLEKEMI